MSAVSIRLIPASRQTSIWRAAPVASVIPTGASGPRSPNVIVPSDSAETRRPERPSWRYSISTSHCQDDLAGHAALAQRVERLARLAPVARVSAVHAEPPVGDHRREQ